MQAQQAFLGFMKSYGLLEKNPNLILNLGPIVFFTTYIVFAHFVRIVHFVGIFSHSLDSTKRGTENTQLF